MISKFLFRPSGQMAEWLWRVTQAFASVATAVYSHQVSWRGFESPSVHQFFWFLFLYLYDVYYVDEEMKAKKTWMIEDFANCFAFCTLFCCSLSGPFSVKG